MTSNDHSHSQEGEVSGEESILRHTCASGSLPALTETPAPSGPVRYGAWTIYYDPPPIPIRTMDWHFVHDNYDASWEGEEDGWVSNGLAGHAASLDACKAEIDEMEADRAAS